MGGGILYRGKVGNAFNLKEVRWFMMNIEGSSGLNQVLPMVNLDPPKEDLISRVTLSERCYNLNIRTSLDLHGSKGPTHRKDLKWTSSSRSFSPRSFS